MGRTPRKARRGSGRPVTYRGKVLGPTTLEEIRRLARTGGCRTRTQVARQVCRRFGWRRPNGELPIGSCRQLLARLERAGFLDLPPSRAQPRRKPARRDPRQEIGAHGSFEPSPSAQGLVVRPILRHERPLWRRLMDEHHYLGDRQPPGESLRYVALWDGRAVGLIGWASATLDNAAREAWIGWNQELKHRRLHLVATNVRFLMLPGARVANLASRVLSTNLRRLSRDWEVAYDHRILLAETFVDRSRYRGTCYLASNWRRVGETKGWSRRGSRYWKHGQPKDVLVYPVTRRARRWLSATESPVDAWSQRGGPMKINVEALPLRGEGGLFDILEAVKDPRKRRGIRHPIASVLAIAVTAVVSGARSLVAIAQWAEELEPEARMKLGGDKWAAPSEPTFRRVLGSIDATEVEAKLSEWISKQVTTLDGEGLALDGKTMRGTGHGERRAVHLVSAALHDSALVMAQTRVPDKTNEIKSVEPLLDGADVKGAVLTGDAMFTQRDIARHIVEDKEADYLFTVKANQPGLLAAIENVDMASFSPSVHPKRPGARSS